MNFQTGMGETVQDLLGAVCTPVVAKPETVGNGKTVQNLDPLPGHRFNHVRLIIDREDDNHIRYGDPMERVGGGIRHSVQMGTPPFKVPPVPCQQGEKSDVRPSVW
jgi:hypothetical protein